MRSEADAETGSAAAASLTGAAGTSAGSGSPSLVFRLEEQAASIRARQSPMLPKIFVRMGERLPPRVLKVETVAWRPKKNLNLTRRGPSTGHGMGNFSQNLSRFHDIQPSLGDQLISIAKRDHGAQKSHQDHLDALAINIAPVVV